LTLLAMVKIVIDVTVIAIMGDGIVTMGMTRH
jgi:hypothetical protein